MICLTVSDLSLSFGTDVLLDKVSFALDESDRLGIIGVNGCGKSTLLRLINGDTEATDGNIYFSKGKTVGLLRQDGAFDVGDDNLTVTERMYQAFPQFLRMEKRLAELEACGLQSGDESAIGEYSDLHDRYVRDGGLEFRSRCVSVLTRLGFDENARRQTVGTLSGGQRTRLALAVELSREPDILMLDEPTNHLDIATLSWLESYLSNYKKCFIVISHDRYFLDRVTNKTLSIEHHRATLYNGGYTQSMEQRRLDREIAERHWKNQQKEIARQEAYIAQQRAWNRERNIVAAESRQKQLDKMVKLERPKTDPRSVQMTFRESTASGNDVLDIRNLSMGFVGRPLFSNISFSVKRGERVLIIGPNGCGKSTLVKLLLGQLPPLSGVIETGYHVEVGYYDQENQHLTPSNTVLDELWNAYPTKTETEIRNALARFLFTGEDVFKQVSVLSGGERARLTLCKLMLSKMNLLILDEPTNHLDMDSREALESALSAFDGTIVTVSHDRYLIEKLATRIIELCPEKYFQGDLLDFHIDSVGHGYTEFEEYKTARIAERQGQTANAVEQTAPSTQKEQYLKNKQQAAEERKKKTHLERLKKECADLEAELSAIEAELYGSASTDYVRVAELDKRKQEAEDRLLAIYEELG